MARGNLAFVEIDEDKKMDEVIEAELQRLLMKRLMKKMAARLGGHGIRDPGIRLCGGYYWQGRMGAAVT